MKEKDKDQTEDEKKKEDLAEEIAKLNPELAKELDNDEAEDEFLADELEVIVELNRDDIPALLIGKRRNEIHEISERNSKHCKMALARGRPYL